MILKNLINLIKLLNQYSNIILIVLGVIGFIYVREEYILKIRPFVTVEINTRKENERWYFDVVLVNKGQYPGKARIKNALLKIGDETYPTNFNTEMVLAPN